MSLFLLRLRIHPMPDLRTGCIAKPQKLPIMTVAAHVNMGKRQAGSWHMYEQCSTP